MSTSMPTTEVNHPRSAFGAPPQGGDPSGRAKPVRGVCWKHLSHAGKVLTHRHILREVWGPNYVEQTHYLRVYLAHLREKLEREPSKPRLLITEPGVGYRLKGE